MNEEQEKKEPIGGVYLLYSIDFLGLQSFTSNKKSSSVLGFHQPPTALKSHQ